MTATNLLLSSLAEALGWTLIHALWQGFLIVLTVALLMHLTRESRSAVRYQIGVVGLLAQVLASAVTFGMIYEPHALPVSGAFSPYVFNAVVVATANESWMANTQAFLNAHLAEVVWAWMVGVGVFGVRLVGGWVYVQRLRQTATMPVPAALTQAAERIARDLNVSAHLRLSARVSGPMVVGVLKPVVLWPVGLLAGLSATDVEAILAHELAHVRRHDYALNVLQSVVEVLYFFHPALWWLSARVREEREHCCDDVAVSVVGDARVLARALARVEEWQRQTETTPVLAMAFAGKRQLLLHRVRRMLGVQTRPLVSNGSLAGLTLATLLLLSVSVYAVGRSEDKLEKPVRKLLLEDKQLWVFKSDKTCRFGLEHGKRLSYVVWQGKQLPSARVAQLRTYLEQVENGTLAISAVPAVDRVILEKIVTQKTNAQKGFEALGTGVKALVNGLDGLGEGLKNVSFEEIKFRLDTTKHVKGQVIDSVKVNNEWVKISDYYRIYDVSMPKRDTSRLKSAQRELEALTKKMQEVMAERQPLIDRLSKEMAELSLKNGDWLKMNKDFERQAEAMAKQQTALARQQTQMAQQQNELARKLAPLDAELAKLSRMETAQGKALMRQKELQRQRYEKEMDRLGDEMGKLGSQMGDMGKELEPLQSKLEPYHDRMGQLADSISKLVEPTYEISAKISELSSQISEEAYKEVEKSMRIAEEAMRGVGYIGHPGRAPRAYVPRVPRAPRYPRAPRAAYPSRSVPRLAPPPPPEPAQAPVPRFAPAPRPVPAPPEPPRAVSPKRGTGKIAPAPAPAKAPKVGDAKVKIEGSAEGFDAMTELSELDKEVVTTTKAQVAELAELMKNNPEIKSTTFEVKGGDKLKNVKVSIVKHD
ncbi:MAG: hypothetical protein EAZ91_08350 [Cytophagales bacterium]|nr:MAG: hypothetical protein EAZ91_08350 [Cytophagales bacterium]